MEWQMASTRMPCAIALVIAFGLTACTKHEVPEGGLLKRFEDLGCSADWNDESSTPEVLRRVDDSTTTLLVRHHYGCGYDRATNPTAELENQVLKLGYQRSIGDGDGDLPACICEYRVRFDIETPALPISEVRLNGETTRLSEGARLP